MEFEGKPIKLRSLMFVPATEKMLNKMNAYDADAFIIDLEDSISESDKEDALERCVAVLKRKARIENIFVRVNKDLAFEEIKKLKQFNNLGIMLPKFESSEDYVEFSEMLEGHFTIALVETPMGIVNIRQIADCKYVNGIAFGAEDYTAAVNMENADCYLNSLKTDIVANAKAFNKKVFDTPSFKIRDEEMFRQEVDNSVALGFDGKLLITPRHIEYINKAFGCVDLEYMREVIDAFEKNQKAVFVYDGKVYEKMHIERIKRIIKENGGY